MSEDHDEICAADLANVVDGRNLVRSDASWLARAVVGAIRPNRDKPLWDLAHLLVVLAHAGDVKRVIDLVLDPRLSRADALREQLAKTLPADVVDEQGVTLATIARPWRMSWAGAARRLSLGEFLLTMENLGAFQEIASWIAEAAREPVDVDLLVKRLTRRINQYRQAHVPLAPIEKRFRAILVFLAQGDRGVRGVREFDDADILAYWRHEIDDGARPLFRTVAEHFLTYAMAASSLNELRSLSGAASLEAIENWADRLDAMLGDVAAGGDVALALAQRLAAIAETPKILTGSERDDLIDIVFLEPFHRTRPLTVLRATSFGRVQSGIANHLRRGGGGASIAERVDCAEAAAYADILARADALSAHLRRMIRIAAALRFSKQAFDNPEIVALLQVAESDIKKVRRAGFDDREALARAFAEVDDTLIAVADEVDRFSTASAAVDRKKSLSESFAQDRVFFSEALKEAYIEKEAAHGDSRQRSR